MHPDLTKAQMAELREALVQRFDDLREEIHQELLSSDNAAFAELASQVHDTEEESVADLLVDMNLASLNRHVRELRDVEEALLRMKQGSYGICVDTGEPIPYERLKVNPAAARTVEAQEIVERLSWQTSRPSL